MAKAKLMDSLIITESNLLLIFGDDCHLDQGQQLYDYYSTLLAYTASITDMDIDGIYGRSLFGDGQLNAAK